MSQQSLEGRTVYIPQMSYGGAYVLAAAFRSIGLEAEVAPTPDAETLELGGRYTSGDECLPERITLGDFLKISLQPGFDAKKAAFFMPTAGGPCRFGQYGGFVHKVMNDLGHKDLMMLSPTSSNAYAGIGDSNFVRTGWRAVVAADAIQKLQLKIRPYEVNPGDADTAYEESLRDGCDMIALPVGNRERLEKIVEAIVRSRERFRAIPVKKDSGRPLIGVVGEIFCRHHEFSNESLIRKVEEFGGEVWLSDVAEWVWYTGSEERKYLRLRGQRFSKAMVANKIRTAVQQADEHAILRPIHDDLKGYEEPEVEKVLAFSEPYLPVLGALGEMVLNVGKSIYLYEKGADGIIDISPFTCMNGIICEAIYPRVSREHEGLPIRTFYFDGNPSDLDRDIGIFIELARNYQRKKTKQRH